MKTSELALDRDHAPIQQSEIGSNTVKLCIAFIIVATSAIILRFWSRATVSKGKRFQADDWAALASLVRLWVICGESNLLTTSPIADGLCYQYLCYHWCKARPRHASSWGPSRKPHHGPKMSIRLVHILPSRDRRNAVFGAPLLSTSTGNRAWRYLLFGLDIHWPQHNLVSGDRGCSCVLVQTYISILGPEDKCYPLPSLFCLGESSLH